MITKQVQREDEFNQAQINHIYDNGDMLVTLLQVDEDGEVVNRHENIVYHEGSIELTEDELNSFTTPSTPDQE